MGKNLSLADFTKVAAKIGFSEQEISELFGTKEIHSSVTASEDQKSVLDKIVSLSAVCGENWLDNSSPFKVPEDMANQSARQIITGTKDGLDKYIVAVEAAAGGPLAFRR